MFSQQNEKEMEEFIGFEKNHQGLLQGHTIRIYKPGFLNDKTFAIVCVNCDFRTEANSMEEARFDVRYHGLKQHLGPEPDWEKLL